MSVKSFLKEWAFVGVMFAATIYLAVSTLTEKPSPYHPLTTSVVRIGGDPNNPLAHGSGVLISNNTIITNRHVAENLPENPEVMYNDGTLVKGETVLVSKGKMDIAIIRVPETTVKPALIACRLPVHGEEITVVGYPLAQSNVVLRGIVAALKAYSSEEETEYAIVQAPVNPGNSGGPAFDSKGKVMGIVTAYLAAGSGMFGPPQNSGLGLIQPSNRWCDVLGLR